MSFKKNFFFGDIHVSLVKALSVYSWTDLYWHYVRKSENSTAKNDLKR